MATVTHECSFPCARRNRQVRRSFRIDTTERRHTSPPTHLLPCPAHTQTRQQSRDAEPAGVVISPPYQCGRSVAQPSRGGASPPSYFSRSTRRCRPTSTRPRPTRRCRCRLPKRCSSRRRGRRRQLSSPRRPFPATGHCQTTDAGSPPTTRSARLRRATPAYAARPSTSCSSCRRVPPLRTATTT